MPIFAPVVRSDDEKDDADALVVGTPVCVDELAVLEATIEDEAAVEAGDDSIGEDMDEVDEDPKRYAFMAIPCTLLKLVTVVVRSPVKVSVGCG